MYDPFETLNIVQSVIILFFQNEPGYRKHKVKIAALCPGIADTDIIKIQPDQVTNLPMIEKVFKLVGILP